MKLKKSLLAVIFLACLISLTLEQNGSTAVNAPQGCPSNVIFSPDPPTVNHTISWSGSGPIILQYDNNSDFSSPEVDVLVSSNSYNASLPSSGLYYYRFLLPTDPPGSCGSIASVEVVDKE